MTTTNETETYHAQGGGTVEWNTDHERWEFVEPPFDFPEFKPGDPMPEEWGIA